MSVRVVLERHAEEDFTAHVDYIARDRPAAALAFIDAVENAFARLAAMPEIGTARPFRTRHKVVFCLVSANAPRHRRGSQSLTAALRPSFAPRSLPPMCST